MATCWVDGITGDDANPGTITQPKKTYAAARAVAITSNPQLVVSLRGYFREGNFGTPATTAGWYHRTICLGQTIFDGEGVKTKFTTLNTAINAVFVGATFKNFTTDHIVYANTGGSGYHKFFNCVYINELGGNPDVYSFPFSRAQHYQCTLAAMRIEGSIHIYSSYLDAACVGYSPVVAYNAAANSAWRGTGGWDIATYPGPFVDAGNSDYRFDPAATYFTKYRTEGQDGGQVGASALGGMYYHKSGNGIGLDDHVLGVWENDSSYYDDSFQQVVVGSTNQNIDFTDDDGSFIASVANTTYTDGATLATAIQTAFNATASTQTYTCTFNSSTMRYTITNTTGALLSLLWTTTSNSIGDDIGFDTSTDDTGVLSYTSDDAVTVGGAAGTTRVVLSGSSFEMDTALEPLATSARGLGPVQDFGRAIIPKGLIWTATESGASVVDNSQATSTREIEVSGNSSSVWTSPEIAWAMVARGTNMSFSAKRYWRQRVVLRTNGTP